MGEGISRINHGGRPGKTSGQRDHQGILTCPQHIQPPSEGVFSLKPLQAVLCGHQGCYVKRGGVRGSLCLSFSDGKLEHTYNPDGKDQKKGRGAACNCHILPNILR